MTSLEFNYKLTEHCQYLNMVAAHFTTDANDAQDLIQDTCLKAIVNKDKFQESTNFKAWLYTIMRNTAINSFRKRKNDFRLVDESKADYSPLLRNISFDSAESLILKNEIQSLIGKLNEEIKKPFELFTKGYKYKEIEKILNIPLGTVKSRIFFARKKLSLLLD